MHFSTSIILLFAGVYCTLAAPIGISRQSDIHVYKRAEYGMDELEYLLKREVEGELHLFRRTGRRSSSRGSQGNRNTGNQGNTGNRQNQPERGRSMRDTARAARTAVSRAASRVAHAVARPFTGSRSRSRAGQGSSAAGPSGRQATPPPPVPARRPRTPSPPPRTPLPAYSANTPPGEQRVSDPPSFRTRASQAGQVQEPVRSHWSSDSSSVGTSRANRSSAGTQRNSRGNNGAGQAGPSNERGDSPTLPQ